MRLTNYNMKEIQEYYDDKFVSLDVKNNIFLFKIAQYLEIIAECSKNNEVNKMDEDTTNEYIKDKVVVVTDISVVSNPKEFEEIYQIRFTTDVGDITWKPKIQREQYRNGLKILTRECMKIKEIPTKLVEMSAKINQFTRIKVKVNYTKMTTSDNTEYRFITSGNTFDEWEILNNDPTTQTI